MKKVLTVLAILVVLTSAIFAETHKLKIEATSVEVVPAFEMSIGDVKTNTAKADFGTADNTTLVKTDIAKTFDFETGATVNVLVKILNAAKTKTNYKLTFSDGVFQVKRNTVASSDTGTNLHVTPSITVIEKSGTGYASTASTTEEGVLTLDFNGTKCTANSEVAGATFVYAPDATIDPDTYTADIQLDIVVD